MENCYRHYDLLEGGGVCFYGLIYSLFLHIIGIEYTGIHLRKKRCHCQLLIIQNNGRVGQIE